MKSQPDIFRWLPSINTQQPNEEIMHHYAAALITVTALPVALILAHEYTEHRKRKAEARRAAAAEAMMARAIERGFIAAARRRAAEREAEAQRAAQRAQLEAIAAAYYNRRP